MGKESPGVLLLLQAAGLKCPDQQRRSRGARLCKYPKGNVHSGQQWSDTGLWTWLGSDQLGAMAVCGQVWKGWCRHILPSGKASSVVSGTAEITSMAWTHQKSWTSEGIAESLICLPVMCMRFISLLLHTLYIEEYDKNACKHLNILNCFSWQNILLFLSVQSFTLGTQAHWIHVCGAFASSWFQSV